MGRIQFKQYYTTLVEHFFRLAVRYPNAQGVRPAKWYKFTTDWINKQSEEDKVFIQSVFDRNNYYTSDGLHRFDNGETFEVKSRMLHRIERQFAIDARLYDGTESE